MVSPVLFTMEKIITKSNQIIIHLHCSERKEVYHGYGKQAQAYGLYPVRYIKNGIKLFLFERLGCHYRCCAGGTVY